MNYEVFHLAHHLFTDVKLRIRLFLQGLFLSSAGIIIDDGLVQNWEHQLRTLIEYIKDMSLKKLREITKDRAGKPCVLPFVGLQRVGHD